MPKYLLEVSYTLDGIRGLRSEGGTSREEAARAAAASVGIAVEAYYFAFGATDCFVLVDAPSSEAAAALAMTVSASGGATVQTTALLTPVEMDAAARRSVDYRPPGS